MVEPSPRIQPAPEPVLSLLRAFPRQPLLSSLDGLDLPPPDPRGPRQLGDRLLGGLALGGEPARVLGVIRHGRGYLAPPPRLTDGSLARKVNLSFLLAGPSLGQGRPRWKTFVIGGDQCR